MFDLKSKTFWKYALIIALIILLFPVVLNFLLFQFNSPFAYGEGDTWLSFWGNYSGGIISAIVAYIVANSQIQKQQKLDLAKEKYTRTINQLPALIRIEIELKKFIGEIEKACEHKENLKIAMSSSDRNKDEDEETQENINEYEACIKKYNIEVFNDEYFNLIKMVEDIDLHIDLITCFQFYKDFSFAVTEDLNILVSKLTKLAQENIKDHIAGGSDIGDSDKLEEANQIHLKIIDSKDKKHSIWTKFNDDNMKAQFENAHEGVNNVIEHIRHLKKKGKPY